VTGLTSGLAQMLAAQGRRVVACLWCGGALAADLTHDGAPLPQATRRYCSKKGCRTAAANARRRPVARTKRRYVRRHGALITRHQLEAAGQEGLPGMPVLPKLPAMEAVS
jgi:hypothetical protein